MLLIRGEPPAMKRRTILILGLPMVGLLLLAYASSSFTPSSRRYYEGPVSDHFDGKRFFNPEGETGTGGARKNGMFDFLKVAAGDTRHVRWPDSVPVVQRVPQRRVEGKALTVTWIGHSTVLVQTQGLNILTDPVWAERDSPVQILGPRRVREPGVRLDKLPPIDVILISHNHYDHLDIATLKYLHGRDHPKIITGLGNDRLLAGYGIQATAGDWGTSIAIKPGISVTIMRAHHWSARWIDDIDRSLWVGFKIGLSGGDIYYSGDTGPGKMQWLSQARGTVPIRLAILPIAPYRDAGPQTGNHIDPYQAVTAFTFLHAAYGLGVHWGTFNLGSEPIDEPVQRLGEALKAQKIDTRRFRTTTVGVGWNIPEI
jgi:L-ascorbate metabolism protein UlaG (beta-lactamase superfamily)